MKGRRARPWQIARKRYAKAMKREGALPSVGGRPHTQDPHRDACSTCGRSAQEITEQRLRYCDGGLGSGIVWCDGVPEWSTHIDEAWNALREKSDG